MIFFTPTAIIIASLSAFCIAFLWYSPAFFFKAWLLGEGVTKEHLPKRTPLYLVSISLYSLVAYAAIASVLAILFDVLGIVSLSVAVSLGLLLGFGFVVTTRFVDMLYTSSDKHYEKKSQVKFLVASGFYLSAIATMSVAIFLTAYF